MSAKLTAAVSPWPIGVSYSMGEGSIDPNPTIRIPKLVNGWPNSDPNVYPYPIDNVVVPKETQEEIRKQIEGMQKKSATKLDTGKTNWSLVPFEAIEEIAKVLEFGATKYSANNWRYGRGLGTLRVLNAALRHIFAYMRGEELDAETGISHLSHAACNLCFAIYYVKHKEKFLQDGVNEKNT